LNGKVMDHGSGYTAYAGTGTLTITDSSAEKSGKITGTRNPVYLTGGKSLILEGGTIEKTGEGGDGSNHYGSAIYNESTGSITISGGEIKVSNASDSNMNYYGIYNKSTGSVFLTGGQISVTAGGLSGNKYYGIYNSSNGSVYLSGGKVHSAEYAVYYEHDGNLQIGPGVMLYAIQKGSTGPASLVNLEDINTPDKIKDYKYIEIIAPTAQIEGNYYYELADAFNEVNNGQTIKLLADVTLTESLSITNNNSFTLDLNGKTINQLDYYSEFKGAGTLTITDSSAEKNGKIKGTKDLIYLNEGKSILLVSGMMEKSGQEGSAIKNFTSGSVTISGGELRVISNNDSFKSYYGINNLYNGRVTISGGKVSVIGGAGSYNTYCGIWNNYTGADVIISGGEVSITGGDGEAVNSYGIFFHEAGCSLTLSAGKISSIGHAVFFISDGSLQIDPNIRIYAIKTDETDTAVISKDKIDMTEEIKDYKYLELLPVTEKPATNYPVVTKSSKPQKSVTFVLCLVPYGTYKAYADNETDIALTDITFWILGDELIMTYTGADFPAGTYYISVTESGKAESDRLALTVADPAPEELTGNVTVTGTLKYGETLTAEYIPGNNTGTLSYQWKRVSTKGIDSIDVGGNTNIYQLVREDIGYIISCVISSNEQTGFVSGSTDSIIEKLDGLSVTGVEAVACTTEENNDGQLKGMTFAMEFKREGGEYIPVSAVSGSVIVVTGGTVTITGLESGNYYVRYAGTNIHYAGPESIYIIYPFTPEPILTYTVSGIITDSVSNTAIAGANVQLKSGGSNMGSAAVTDGSGAYTISGVHAGSYTIEVSAEGYNTATSDIFVISTENINGVNLSLTKTVTFKPVTGISMGNAASVQAGVNLTLTGIITPADATKRTIVWSVENANGTGASIIGNTFRAACCRRS